MKSTPDPEHYPLKSPDIKFFKDQIPLKFPDMKSIWDQIPLKFSDIESILDQIPLKSPDIKPIWNRPSEISRYKIYLQDLSISLNQV